MQPEALTADYIKSTDELKEVPTCTIGGKRLFYAQGPISWSTTDIKDTDPNPYSDYGYFDKPNRIPNRPV